MRFYNMYDDEAYYYIKRKRHNISLKEGFVSQEDLNDYLSKYKRISLGAIVMDRIEDDILYFYCDEV